MKTNPIMGVYDKTDDVSPTINPRRASSAKSFSKLLRNRARKIRDYHIRVHLESQPNITLGRAVPVNTYVAEQLREETYTTIPDVDKQIHPVFGVNQELVESNIPERQASESIDVLNEFEIDVDEVNAFKDLLNDLTESTQSIILRDCVANFIAFDNASSTTQAIMRDGLNINMEVSAEVVPALENIARLSVTSHFLSRSNSIPDNIKNVYLREVAKLLATETVTDMRKKEVGGKYSSLLQNLVARFRSAEGKVNNVSDMGNNPVGAMRNREGHFRAQKDQEINQ